MMLAAIGDTSYDIVLVLHIVSVLAAFAPAFVHPFLENQTRQLDPAERGRVLTMMHANGRRIYAPALIVAGLLGFALQGMSDSVWEFSQTWMWLSAVAWIAMNGVLHAVLLPAEKAVADGDESARPRVQAGGTAITVLLLLAVYLMVFKPGL